MADVVYVVNNGDKPHEGKLNGVPYVIPTDGERHIMDREAAVKDFGDWTARNLGPRPRDRKRDKEYTRILGLYGLHKGAMVPARSENGQAVIEDDGRVKEVLSDNFRSKWLPKVEIFEQDGTKAITVIEDPEGKTLPLEGAAAEDVTRVVASQDERIAALERQLQETYNLTAASQETVSAPKDEPKTAKRPQGRKPEVTASQVSRD